MFNIMHLCKLGILNKKKLGLDLFKDLYYK